MKLSKNTLAIFKNFAGISNSLRIRPGNVLLTATESRSVVVQARVEEEFDVDMGIYDLSQFLGAVSILEDPDIVFGTHAITITDKHKSIKMSAGSTKVVEGPKRFPLIADPIVSFPFTTELLTRIQKASGILSAPDFSVSGDGKDVSVRVFDKRNEGGSNFTQKVGESDKEFSAIMKVDVLRLVPSDYEAFLCDKRMVVFRSLSQDLTYCTGVDPDSTFGW